MAVCGVSAIPRLMHDSEVFLAGSCDMSVPNGVSGNRHKRRGTRGRQDGEDRGSYLDLAEDATDEAAEYTK